LPQSPATHVSSAKKDTSELKQAEPAKPLSSGARSDAAAFAGREKEVVKGIEGTGLYRLLVESVLDYAIFALDPRGHIISWNAGAERIKGYRPDEIIGRHFSKFYPPEDIKSNKPGWELEVAERDGRIEDEGWRVRKDGTQFWANVVITALRDRDGSLVGFAKVTRDLTERRRADEQLRQSEERFRLIVQNVRDYGIFMLDSDGRVASWNEGAHRIKGYTADEIIGRHFSTFYPEEDVRSGKPPWELEVAKRDGRFEDEGWRLRKDGTRFWANVIITALRDGTGRLVGFGKVTRDLTERRAAQERAIADARRLAEIETANRTKSEFLAAMSHELRTPLNAIGGYTELLSLGVGGDPTDQQKEYLGRIRASQQHLLAIITDLLNYSRIEAGQVSYDLAAVPLRSMIETLLPLLEPQAMSKGVALTNQPCDPSFAAMADKTKAEQVILNLLTNAVKFTPSGGSVSVECDATRESVSIMVRDTGPGIPDDKQNAIFEPFVQLGRTLTSAHEGAGLGLAISRDLARAMGGDVTVRSIVNEGSTFVLTLPRATPGA
jgi:PAS domain S-box-containing protein